jgi:hypothetical protein
MFSFRFLFLYAKRDVIKCEEAFKSVKKEGKKKTHHEFVDLES